MHKARPLKWPEERIRAEISRLDKKTGLCGATLPIRLVKRARSLGSFHMDGNENPLYFTFTQSYFEDRDFSEDEALDTIRHEYAHYMKHALYPGCEESHHGPLWHKCCLQVSAAPNRYYNIKYAQHLRLRTLQKEQTNESIYDFMEELTVGQQIDHPVYGTGHISYIHRTKDNARITLTFIDGQVRIFGAKWIMENCSVKKNPT